MHEYHIAEMKRDFIERIKRCKTPDWIWDVNFPYYVSKIGDLFEETVKEHFTHKIADVWYIDDVLDAARNLEVELSDKEAQEILERLLNKFDASVGINWDVIECHILDYVEDRKENI